MTISTVRSLLTVSARKRVPTPMGSVRDLFGATHLWVVARLVPLIGDEVEGLLHRSVDDDLTFDADHVPPPLATSRLRPIPRSRHLSSPPFLSLAHPASSAFAGPGHPDPVLHASRDQRTT